MVARSSVPSRVATSSVLYLISDSRAETYYSYNLLYVYQMNPLVGQGSVGLKKQVLKRITTIY